LLPQGNTDTNTNCDTRTHHIAAAFRLFVVVIVHFSLLLISFILFLALHYELCFNHRCQANSVKNARKFFHEAVPQERLDKGAATVDEQVLAFLSLQRLHCCDYIAFEHGSVLQAVHSFAEISGVGCGRPIGGQALVGDAPQQEGIALKKFVVFELPVVV